MAAPINRRAHSFAATDGEVGPSYKWPPTATATGGTGGSAPRSPYGAASGNSHRPYAKFRSEGRGALGTVPPLFGLGNGDTVPLTFQGTGEELAVSVIRSQNHKILLSLYNSKVNEHDRFQCTLYFQCYHLYIPGHFS